MIAVHGTVYGSSHQHQETFVIHTKPAISIDQELGSILGASTPGAALEILRKAMAQLSLDQQLAMKPYRGDPVLDLSTIMRTIVETGPGLKTRVLVFRSADKNNPEPHDVDLGSLIYNHSVMSRLSAFVEGGSVVLEDIPEELAILWAVRTAAEQTRRHWATCSNSCAVQIYGTLIVCIQIQQFNTEFKSTIMSLSTR